MLVQWREAKDVVFILRKHWGDVFRDLIRGGAGRGKLQDQLKDVEAVVKKSVEIWSKEEKFLVLSTLERMYTICTPETGVKWSAREAADAFSSILSSLS